MRVGFRITVRVTTAVLEWVIVLVVVVRSLAVLEMEVATWLETTGGTPCVTGGIGMIASEASE